MKSCSAAKTPEKVFDKVILGLRMPEYERMLVISAAKVAGIKNIEELYIDEFDQLSSKALPIA